MTVRYCKPRNKYLGTDQGYVVVRHGACETFAYANVLSEHATYPEAQDALRRCEYRDDSHCEIHGCCPRSMNRVGYCEKGL